MGKVIAVKFPRPTIEGRQPNNPPSWIAASTSEQLSEIFWNTELGDQWCDEIHLELNKRGRGDLCRV
jgi:hypothetical protein